jgi:hypothetical protein
MLLYIPGSILKWILPANVNVGFNNSYIVTWSLIIPGNIPGWIPPGDIANWYLLLVTIVISEPGNILARILPGKDLCPNSSMTGQYPSKDTTWNVTDPILGGILARILPS